MDTVIETQLNGHIFEEVSYEYFVCLVCNCNAPSKEANEQCKEFIELNQTNKEGE